MIDTTIDYGLVVLIGLIIFAVNTFLLWLVNR